MRCNHSQRRIEEEEEEEEGGEEGEDGKANNARLGLVVSLLRTVVC